MGAQAVRLSNVDIDKALENKDFEVLFQPIFDLGNGSLARMETFVRWRHPALGVLPPGAFISFFESQGRMSELTRYILAEALDHYIDWRGPYEPGFSINLALSDLSDETFCTHFKKLLRDRSFPADLVTLECPMPAIDTEIEASMSGFKALRETGARLAIEVRGRANDFLRSVNPFPFDEIKTGGASILRFARTVRGPGLSAISDLLDIANKANAAITAVGVEDQSSLAALRGLGFTAAQGNHLAKVGGLKDFLPGRVNEVRELLELPALNDEDLAALFRTKAPSLKATPSDSTAAENPAKVSETQAQATPSADDVAKRNQAREKAKALALAKRAKAREIRKAAAIKRAKAKAAMAQKPNLEQANEAQGASSETAQPKVLQDRLTQEFAGDLKTTATAKPASSASCGQAPKAPAPDTIIDAKVEDIAPVAKATPPQQATSTVSAPDADMIAFSEDEEPEAAAPVTTPPVDQVALPKAKIGAQFWPTLSVGGPARNANISPIKTAQDKVEEPAPQPAPVVTEPSPEVVPAPDPISAPSSSTIERAMAEEESNKAADLSDAIGDLQEEPVSHAPAPRRRKPKNLLTRKYKIVPTHFWPKSWKRAYRRWKSDSEQDAAAA
ncbi:MAG: hypothetical protein DHS20C05_10050 [Hyphococcus sp.]|nr:MAG: hypothetical protein DHS20C05_10050 [Marinicaulis sp.]